MMRQFSQSVSGLALAVMLLSTATAHAQTAADRADAAEVAAEGAAEVDAADASAAIAVDAAAEAVKSSTVAACAGAAAVWVGGDSARAQLDGAEQPWMIDLRASTAQGRLFRLSEPASVRLETLTKNKGDPRLQLFDAAGDTLAESDDAAGSYNAQIVMHLEAGEYCIVAEDIRTRMDLTLLVGLEDHDSVLEASELACGPQTQARDLGEKDLDAVLAAGPFSYQSDASGHGYVKFKVTDGGPLSLRATAGNGIDPMMALFDETGNEIANNNDADGVNARLDFMNGLPSGSYCVGIRSATPADGQIAFTAQVLDIDSYKRAAYERGDLAPVDGSYPVGSLAFNRPHGEIILQGNAVTWMEFELQERSIVALRTMGTPSGADTMLSLFDGVGEMIVQVDDTDSSRNAAIAPMVLQKGRYLVALSDRASSSQLGAPLRPVVLLAERYVRAPQD